MYIVEPFLRFTAIQRILCNIGSELSVFITQTWVDNNMRLITLYAYLKIEM